MMNKLLLRCKVTLLGWMIRLLLLLLQWKMMLPLLLRWILLLHLIQLLLLL
jgi:hypothetical protein